MHFLLTAAGKAALHSLYEEQGLPERAIAERFKTSVWTVSRALRHHKIRARSRSEAQKLALRKGRSKYPRAKEEDGEKEGGEAPAGGDSAGQ